MMRPIFAALPVLLLSAVMPAVAFSQPPSSSELIREQKAKLLPLKRMDGLWRGNAWRMLPNGEKTEFIQTERVGPMLDGAVKVVEGRGFDSDGEVVFNAFAAMAYNRTSQELSMRSYAQGHVGDFTITVTEKGFSWKIPAGPMTISYVAEVTDEKWFEYGERIIPGRDPVRFFEMTLTRIGDTAWPAAHPSELTPR